jgi:nucleoid-associated protein YgaU
MQEKEAQEPKYIAEHTLTAEETLSHLSLKYYGHATKPYWMVIYEANKDVIGDNPNRVRPGLEIKIPELPEELKDK